MPNNTRLYERMRQYVLHISKILAIPSSEKGKKKLGTSYKNSTISEKEQKYHGQPGGDNVCG